ncbi:hypothetical protein PR003_g18874 [Phytophthora rubi]|uniref:Uncharacterized protein n=1 Tax=Phytophthora rubi TaxID=129364 RepID=A0A6A4E2C9_9STRA|nr:hypothetical protein PR002_g22721 [Phytophthora rubi]KAE9315862.1 hypothetical protein PR003_g18874 [Phytophthora rubi]
MPSGEWTVVLINHAPKCVRGVNYTPNNKFRELNVKPSALPTLDEDIESQSGRMSRAGTVAAV